MKVVLTRLGGLLGKELRGLLPIVLLLILFPVGVTLIDRVTMSYIDAAHAFSIDGGLYRDGKLFISVLNFFVGFGLGSSMLVKELDGRTAEFLDGLPVGRFEVYLSKVVAVWLVLLVGPLSSFIQSYVFYLSGYSSLSGAFPWEGLWPLWLGWYAQAVVMVGYGLALGPLRRFGWVAVTTVAVWVSTAHQETLAAGLSLTDLVSVNFIGPNRQMAWTALWTQLVVAGAGYLVGGLLYASRGHGLADGVARFSESNWGRRATFVAAVALVGLWTSLLGTFDAFTSRSTKAREKAGLAGFRSFRRASADTEHYRFLIPRQYRAVIRPVLRDADQVYEQVREQFEGPALDQIVVDTTRSLKQHNRAGQAHGQLVLVDVHDISSSTATLVVLAHETSHVYTASIAKGRMRDASQTTRILEEGLAQYVERNYAKAVFPKSRHADETPSERVVAALWSRDDIKLDLLLDNRKLVQRHDHVLAYYFGEQLVVAMVERYGKRAPFDFIRALGRADAPTHLDGLALWEDTLQAANMDLEGLREAFEVRMALLTKRHERFTKALPRLVGAVETDDAGRLGVVPIADSKITDRWESVIGFGDRSYYYGCLFRAGPNAASAEIVVGRVDEDGTCWQTTGPFKGQTQILLYLDSYGHRIPRALVRRDPLVGHGQTLRRHSDRVRSHGPIADLVFDLHTKVIDSGH